MIVTVTIRLELARDVDAEALDAWAWALERQIEELNLVVSASVEDATIRRQRSRASSGPLPRRR